MLKYLNIIRSVNFPDFGKELLEVKSSDFPISYIQRMNQTTNDLPTWEYYWCI